MAFYLGIDGGGTSTRCAVGDEHCLLGRASGRSCKIARVGREAARQALLAVVRQACMEARVNPQEMTHSCIGVSGASRAEVVEAVQSWAGEIVGGQVKVVGDTEVAFEAALGSGAGVIVIAGTGSICFGKNQQNQTARAGGGGTPSSDEGSGDWIGYRALQESLQRTQPSKAGFFLAEVMKLWRCENAEEIKTRMQSQPAPDFAALFPQVESAATAGDAVAKDVLLRAADALASLTRNVIVQLWPPPRRVSVAISGGVFQYSSLVRETFVTNLRRDLKPSGFEIAISLGVAEPVLGALHMARRAGVRSATGTRE